MDNFPVNEYYTSSIHWKVNEANGGSEEWPDKQGHNIVEEGSTFGPFAHFILFTLHSSLHFSSTSHCQ